MSARRDAARRLAEQLPELLYAVNDARSVERKREVKSELAREFEAFAEACAGPSRRFVPTPEQQRHDVLLHALEIAGATEAQAIQVLHEQLEAHRAMLREAAERRPPAPIVIESPLPTDIRLTAAELDAVIERVERNSRFPLIIKSALAKLRAVRGQR